MRYGRKIFYITLPCISLIPCLVYLFLIENKEIQIPALPTERRHQQDFIDHPVYDHGTLPPKVSTDKPQMINVFKSSVIKTDKDNLCVNLKTPKGPTPICIFDPAVDRMISSYVNDYGTWEQELLNETGYILSKKPHLTFVDVGCNLGTFTLFNAKLGIRVIAIDALKPALERLELSLIKGGLRENVTILLNAISDKREHVAVHVVKDNPGGSYIEHNQTSGDNSIHAIILDDIVSLVSSKSVFLKMDIEGNEYIALKAASRFFQLLNVEHVLMEWAFHRFNPNGQYIIQFLLRNGMLPFEKLSSHSPLNLAKSYQWPDNIFWSKR